MKKYRYVIIGGGMAADAAVDGIREIDKNNEILLLSDDEFPPYNRPPLSKGLWSGKDIETIWRKTDEKDVSINQNSEVVRIEKSEKKLTTVSGESFGYEKLLLATGGTPKKLPFKNLEIIYYRGLSDYKALKQLSEEKKRFAVIGSGFIGSEISASLAINDCEVFLFDKGPGIGWNIFPGNMVHFLNSYYREKGVTIFPNVTIEEIIKTQSKYQLLIRDGKNVEVDAVIAGIGIAPNIALAESAGLVVSNGINVDAYLRSSSEDIFAAGDVANFYYPQLSKHIRMEHADNANAMGKQAGRNMAVANESYKYLPLFYSDLFDLGYEAVGELNSQSEIIEDWLEEYQKGILYYLAGDQIKGVLLWNVWDKVDEARHLIGMKTPGRRKQLIGKIEFK